MPDISAIAGAISALNGMKDIAQAMITLRDAKALQAKVIEFNNAIIDAQAKILLANEERTALLQRVSDLEKQLSKLETWETEKQRYQLADIGGGTFAFALKELMSSGEPPHYICANCYDQNKKSRLHRTQLPGGGNLITCAGCGTKLIVQHGYTAPSYAISAAEQARLALEPCPLCDGGRLKITASEADDTFAFAGVQRRTLTCDKCGHIESRLHDPNK